jgi:hypothetical protein
MMKGKMIGILLFVCISVMAGVYTADAWTPLPVRTDPNLFMPGSQPGQGGTTDGADRCDNCHGGYNTAVEPAFNWRGSMMAQAHRDPLEIAPFTMTLQDSIWATGNPNAGDICIKCHTPLGWLEGRSDPTNGTALTGTDFDGVQCDFCHRMIDPFAKLGQPDVPAETDPIAISMANETYNKDIGILGSLTLFDGTLFLNSTTLLPTYFGNGLLPNYVEAGSGQIFMDPSSAKSGPYYDANAKHKMYYSRYTKSKYFCITCHDVSNPILANLTSPGLTERQAAATYFHIERTGSEFLLSAYGRGDGAPTNIPGVPIADKCQDCHMRDVTGKGCKLSGVATRTDLALHDFTGGNQWMTKILASADTASPNYDPYNYAILSGAKYSGAMIEVGGLQGVGPALLAGSDRAVQQLQMAATLSTVSETTSAVTLKVQNNTGHKLTSGFPEGRRMFLTVKFYDSAGALISEINPYASLVTAKNGQGDDVYVSGGTLRKDRDDLVWETEMSSSLTGESQTFHLALATDRWKDNRVPPKGFDTAGMNERLSQPRWNGADAPNYFTSAEYAGGYDEVTISKPSGAASWYATLYYQTINKEFVEFMRDEINGTGTLTLTSPTPSGEPQAYIIQTDPFFATLKGWGYALWDLWLHNGGAAPVAMASAGMAPQPPCTAPGSPQNLTATGGQRKVTLTWTAGSPAPTGGYNIYYDQAGKYQYITSVSSGTTTYTNTGLSRQTQYCYRVTAWNDCNGNGVFDSGIDAESSVSNIACATTN